MKLNPDQTIAVKYISGPLLVLAGAGSGKTRVITEKIAHLIERENLSAEKIAAITFTNKAAREMRERVAARVSKPRSEGLLICTFHALGLKLLQIEHARAGLRRGFTVFDSDDSFALIKELMPASTPKDTLNQLRFLISNAKNEGLSPEQAESMAKSARERDAADLYHSYQRRLSAFNALDFDDLIRLPLQLLEQNDEVRTAWRERLRYLLVDEYQDTNRAQYRLVKLLAGERGAFTAVGDDDQSIYAWRGANPDNLRELSTDYPKLKVVKLEQNYRCSARILRAANSVIANNPHLFEKKLWSEHNDGETIRVWENRDHEHEAERVAADILHQHNMRKAPWSAFAILYRGNFQARAFEQALRLLKIPYQVSGGMSFFERAEVKDLLSYLRLIANPDDDAAFLRAVSTPKREVGATTLEKLAEQAARVHSSLLNAASSAHVLSSLASRPANALRQFVDLIDELRRTTQAHGLEALAKSLPEKSGYSSMLMREVKEEAIRNRRLANVKEFCDFVGELGKGRRDGLQELAAQLALLSNVERDEEQNAVRLMTLHSAKGLEFDQVYLVGVDDTTLPHEGAIAEGRIDEERRLMYVGITRARARLVLSFAKRVKKYGEWLDLLPSRFLSEIPAAELQWDGADPAAEAVESREKAKSHLDAIAALLG